MAKTDSSISKLNSQSVGTCRKDVLWFRTGMRSWRVFFRKMNLIKLKCCINVFSQPRLRIYLSLEFFCIICITDNPEKSFIIDLSKEIFPIIEKCLHSSYVEGYAKKNDTHILFHSIFNTKNYAFIYICTQRRHFGNSKMVNWVNIVQKLTKIQGKV